MHAYSMMGKCRWARRKAVCIYIYNRYNIDDDEDNDTAVS